MNDKQEIDNITSLFFDIFTNTNGKQVDGKVIHDVCIPECIIIKKDDDSEMIYDLSSFIKPRITILTDGTLTDFKEAETSGQTTIIGNIAQRISKYEKSGNLNGNYFQGRGNKIFSFVKTKSGWRISALMWEDEN